jgi:hypothetical protein
MIFCFSVNTVSIDKCNQSIPLVYVGTDTDVCPEIITGVMGKIYTHAGKGKVVPLLN